MTQKKDISKSSEERRDFVTRVSSVDYHKPMIEKFGDKYKQYRSEWESSAKGEYLPDFPLQIDFEIIDYCNLKCIMCPRSIDRGSGVKLSLENFKKVIDEGAVKGLKAISFGGGDEPLLRKELLEMIGYTSSKGIMDIRLSTNATLLNPELSKNLIKSGLTYITFSIDAYKPETYKKIRGGNLNKVENNVKTFLEILKNSRQDLPITRVSFVVMPENIAERDSFIDRWKPYVSYIDTQDYIELEKPDTIDLKFDPNDFSCYQPWQRVAITADGDVAPCCTFQGRILTIGNIRENTIAECWTSGKMKQLRQQIIAKQPPPECIQCQASVKKQQPNGKLK